ncbi:MAG: insulinase family protein, partial [Akkermansiaceae bacterium]|nr:insulinase family protein [Akkermansiaceae bacterium]
AERERTESGVYASSYLQDFVRDTISPGIERELKFHDRYLEGIRLDEIHQLGREWMTTSNRVILVSGPEKDGFTMPTEAEVLAVFDKVASAALKPYADNAAGLPLLAS